MSVSLYMQYFVQFWMSQFKKDSGKLVCIQNSLISMVKRLESRLQEE